MAKQSAAATAEQSEQEEGREQRESPPKGAESQQRQEGRLARRDPMFAPFMTPFGLLQRFFADDLESLFPLVAGGQGGATPQSQPARGGMARFVPQIDVTQRGNEMVVRADLPGIKGEDVVVEISDDAITISGERQQERTEENDGLYRVERAYGAFFREIPLPEGALFDQAKASFKDGVLEITVPAPPEQVSRGRRLEVSQGDATKHSDANSKGERNQSGR